MKINRENLLNDLATVRAGLSQREFLEQSSCLSAETIIHTLGGDFTIANLLSRKVTDFLVYSTDGEKLVIGEAFGLRKTRSNAEVFQVVFDTGHSIKLTADHLLLMKDGSYRPVCELERGDSVMPFNHRFDQGYYHIHAYLDTGRVRAHEWVFEQTQGKRKQGYHVHHKDLNSWNNSPDNLEQLKLSTHLGLHTKLNPPARMPHVRALQSQRMMGNKISPSKKPWLSIALKGNKNAAKKGLDFREDKRGIHPRPTINHKVVSVECAGREDVYDLSVHKYHNFAANGVFVHNCFVFDGGYVITFNDEISCRKKVDLGVTGAVQAAPLISILEKMDDEDLEVRENEKGELEFKGKRKAFGVTKESEIHLPVDKVEQPSKWHDLSKEFTEAVGLVKHCVSTDESNFKLCCIHLAPEWVEACDNLQIMRVHIKTGLKRSVLVRGTSLGHIVSLAMDRIALTESWIHFKNQNGLVFSCRRHTEEYHPLDKILQFKGHPIVIPKGLAEASDRASVFAMDKAGDALCEVRLKDGVIRIKGQGLSGWFKEVRKVSYNGPPMEFVIAPELLKHISENYQDAEITKTKLKVVGGSWVYCSVLGQPKEEEEETEEAEE